MSEKKHKGKRRKDVHRRRCEEIAEDIITHFADTTGGSITVEFSHDGRLYRGIAYCVGEDKP